MVSHVTYNSSRQLARLHNVKHNDRKHSVYTVLSVVCCEDFKLDASDGR